MIRALIVAYTLILIPSVVLADITGTASVIDGLIRNLGQLGL